MPEAIAASGLDREELLRAGAPSLRRRCVTRRPGSSRWPRGARPVLVGYPIVFDWMFLHWYFVRFCGESPFGFSGALDMKTIYQQKADVPLDQAGRDDLPPAARRAGAHP